MVRRTLDIDVESRFADTLGFVPEASRRELLEQQTPRAPVMLIQLGEISEQAKGVRVATLLVGELIEGSQGIDLRAIESTGLLERRALSRFVPTPAGHLSQRERYRIAGATRALDVVQVLFGGRQVASLERDLERHEMGVLVA